MCDTTGKEYTLNDHTTKRLCRKGAHRRCVLSCKDVLRHGVPKAVFYAQYRSRSLITKRYHVHHT